MLSVPGLQPALYKAVFELLPHAVLLLDEQLCVVLANKAAVNLFQASKTAIQGARAGVLIPDENVERWIADFREEGTKTLEIRQPASDAIRPDRVLRLTIARLRLSFSTEQTARRPTRGRAGRDLRLVVIEDTTHGALIEDQLVQTEKLAAMGQLAAGIAHELANPLASIGTQLFAIRDVFAKEERPDLLDLFDILLDRVDEVRRLSHTLSGFTRQRQPQYELADLNSVIRRSLVFIARDAEKTGIRLEAHLQPELPRVQLDVRIMNQVMLNLLKNAIEAMPRGGTLKVTSGVAALPAGEQAVVCVITDNGVGIDPFDLRKVFRPLYSTKPTGAGLGLPFCRQAVEEHGGDIRIESRRGSGTRVTVTIPV